MKSIHQLILLLISVILFSLFLAACSNLGDPPARIVELYYQALVEKDQTRMLRHACGDWETTAILEYDGFGSVKTELVGFSCQTTNQENNIAHVTCEGAISASYDGELREFPLDQQTFIVVNEGDEWFMCGYEMR